MSETMVTNKKADERKTELIQKYLDENKSKQSQIYELRKQLIHKDALIEEQIASINLITEKVNLLKNK